MECYLKTANANYLLRVFAWDTQALERRSVDEVASTPNVRSIRRSVPQKQKIHCTAMRAT